MIYISKCQGCGRNFETDFELGKCDRCNGKIVVVEKFGFKDYHTLDAGVASSVQIKAPAKRKQKGMF